MKGIIYCRVSTQEQADDGNSLKTQERLCRLYAQKEGLEIVEVFIEEGESAKTISRTKLQEMMKYCKDHQGEIDSLLIYKIDRLSRASVDYATLKAYFYQCGVKVISITEAIEDNPVGRLVETMLAGIAQFDNEVRGERSRNGMIEALKDGRYTFKEPYGFDRVGGRGTSNIVPNQLLAPKIKEVFNLVLEGHRSLEEVRQKAKQIGVVRNDGKALTKSHFYKMLKNPIYKGYINIPKMSIYQKGNFEAIVEPEVFDQVQFVLNGKSKKLPIYKKVNPDFPLRGIVKCGNCRKTMTGNWAKKKYGHYRCTNCKGVNIKKDYVESRFKDYLETIRLNENIANVIKTAIKLNWEQETTEMKKERLVLENQLNDLKHKQNSVIDKNIEGVISDEVARTKISQLESEIAGIRMELLKYNQPEADEQELMDYSINFLTNLSGAWENTEVEIQNKLQKWLFPSGLIFKDGEFTTDTRPLPALLNEELGGENSIMVTLRGIEPRFTD